MHVRAIHSFYIARDKMLEQLIREDAAKPREIQRDNFSIVDRIVASEEAREALRVAEGIKFD